MSIFSRAKSAAKRIARKLAPVAKAVSGAAAVAPAVKPAINKAVSSIKSGWNTASNIAGSANKNTTNASTAFLANQTVAPVSSSFIQGAIDSGALSVDSPSSGGSSGGSSSLNYTPYPGASPIYSSPTTIRGGDSPSTATMSMDEESNTISSSSFGGGSEGGSMASSPSISLPSAPTYSNPGQINNGGLISSLADSYNYDAEKNMFVPLTTVQGEQPQTTETDRRTKLENLLQKMIPKKDSLYDDPLIRRQNREIEKRKQEVNNYTAQLNSVVAQQNADLLRLRGVGSQEGVTETVYGGQAATINREAAIKALPIQAQLSAAQGNLDLAQDYLTQLTTWKKEEIDNEYNYKNSLYSSIRDFVKGEEKMRLDQLTKENDRAWDMKMKNLAIQSDLMGKAITAGNPGVISRISAIDPASPNFMAEVSKVAGSLASSSGSTTAGEDTPLYNGLKPATATAVRGIVSSFKSEPAVTNFVQVQEGRNFAKALSNKTTNPADDQGLIYALAKALDPGSVVREGEYATAQKYAQSWIKAYGKGIEQAIAGTGFLSETARKNIKATIESKYNASKTSYDRVYGEYARQVDDLTGRSDGTKFLRDYKIQDAPVKSPYVIVTPKGQLDMSLFER